jgi:hypothetical protein
MQFFATFCGSTDEFGANPALTAGTVDEWAAKVTGEY